MLARLLSVAIIASFPLSSAANPEGFAVSCKINTVDASDGYQAQANLFKYPNLTYVMVVVAHGGIGLQAYFDGVASGVEDEYKPIAKFNEGFLFQRLEPAPVYDTTRLQRRTEISVPLDFDGFTSLETLWKCDEGGCFVETLQYTASCGDPMPF